jgi:lipid A ethanolaminephosphotransferase
MNARTLIESQELSETYAEGIGSRVAGWLGASRVRFAVVASVWLLAVYNLRFWSESLASVGGVSVRGLAFLAALAVILTIVHSWLLLLLPGRRFPVLFVSALLVAAAVLAYFESEFVVYFDSVMVRNVFETDAAESEALLTPKLLAYFAFLGVLPSLLLMRVSLPKETWRRRLAAGAIATGAGAVVIAALAFAFSANLASFLREHKPLRYLLTPTAFVYNAIANVVHKSEAPRRVAYIEGPVESLTGARGARPLLVFLVVGETARAQNFALGGYQRPTTPRLAANPDVVYFSDVSSCGTSTATSIPCMFSHLGREQFDVDEARAQSNLLDAVTRGGVSVEWRDNNSGCKHVCARVPATALRPGSSDCNGDACFDEELVAGLRERLTADPRNSLLVFHQAGSHGPAYFERYGPEFEKFTPACRSAELAKCDRESVVNAYDNTILHTDSVLADQIGLLESLESDYDSLLIYVSDHGESLGEKGLYLHAAPYFMAPREQTHVPLLLWMSDGYRQRAGIDESCLRQRAPRPASHDDLYHTVLGALGLRSAAYDPAHDLLGGCRSRW